MKKIFLLSMFIINLIVIDVYAGQSCSHITDSDGHVVWRCKNADASADMSFLSDVGDDVYRVYDADMNITDYGVFTKKIDEYGNKTEWIQTYYHGNPNDDIEDSLIKKNERFYTYTNNSRNNNTWFDINYQTYKKITYGADGLPLNEWRTVYSDDGLVIETEERHYTKGLLAENRGSRYKSNCPYDQLEVSSPLCPDRVKVRSWVANISDGKITGKSYYDGKGNLLYTSTVKYSVSGSYKEIFPNGKIRKYNADGTVYVHVPKRIYTFDEAMKIVQKGPKNKFSIKFR